MLENSMVVYRDCDNPYEDHSCELCSPDEFWDEPDSYDDEEE